MTNWRDVRSKVINTPEREAAVTAGVQELRAARLAEIRRERVGTQTQLAEVLPLSQPRISNIEHGDLVHVQVSTLQKYIVALGGNLEIVAQFDDERIELIS